MEYIYVDPALLAIPNYAVDQTTAHELLARVGQFADAILANDFLHVVTSNNIELLLYEGNCPPEHDHLEAFLALMNIEYIFSAQDLVLQYQAIIQRATRSGAICQVETQEVGGFSTNASRNRICRLSTARDAKSICDCCVYTPL
jgi:hypothetical protein